MRKIFLTTLFFFALAMSLMNANASEQAELHWSVCEETSSVILKKLGLSVKEVEQRTVSYFDKWNDEIETFTHHSAGLVLRLRKEEELSKTAVKIKFESFPELSDEWVDLVKCEMDLYSTKKSYFCSLSEESETFTQTQKDFVKTYREEPQWNLLEAHGPATNTVWKLKSQSSIPKLELEEIVLKEGARIYELSTRSAVTTAQSDHQRISAWLAQKKLQVCDVQESKTRQVLESYKVVNNQ